MMARPIPAAFCLLSVLIVVFFGVSRAACPAECTCLSTEVSCDGLNSLPDSGDLFATGKASVVTVSITGSPAVTEIPEDYFVDLPELTNVNLSNNGLTSLNVTSFRYLPNLNNIDLTGNDIACDESIHWVKEWLAAGGDNTLIGNCSVATQRLATQRFPGFEDISGFTDFIDDVVPEMLTFSPADQVIEIVEDTGTTTATVARTSDTLELRTKVVTELDEGTTAADVQVTQTELVFPPNSLSGDIEIQVTDNTDVNTEPRGFNITVYAESILVAKAVGTFSIIDNEVPTTAPPKTNTTTEINSTKKPPTDKSEGGGNAGKHGKVSSPSPAETDEPSGPEQQSGNLAWIIILVIVIIIVIIVVGIFIWKRTQDRKRTTAKEPKAGYSPVKPEGEAKVYNPTTEELA